MGPSTVADFGQIFELLAPPSFLLKHTTVANSTKTGTPTFFNFALISTFLLHLFTKEKYFQINLNVSLRISQKNLWKIFLVALKISWQLLSWHLKKHYSRPDCAKRCNWLQKNPIGCKNRWSEVTFSIETLPSPASLCNLCYVLDFSCWTKFTWPTSTNVFIKKYYIIMIFFLCF